MPLAGFNNSFKLTIDGTKIDEDLTNFPVSITLSSGTGQTGFDATDVFTELTPPTVASGILLHMNGDASDSGHAITTYGTSKLHPATTFSGFNSLGYMEFDGSTEYLTIPGHVDWNFDGDFTIDFWLRNNSGNNKTLIKSVSNEDWNSASTGDWVFALGGDSKLTLYIKGVGNVGAAGTVLSTSVWYHVAIVRSGSSMKLYLNGTPDGNTLNSSATLGNTQMLKIAGLIQTNLTLGSLNGYISELRISKGTDRGWTSNFTPPTELYEKDSYTKLLVHFDGDQSNSNHVVTFSDSMPIYNSPKVWGGSYYFDGVGDYLSIPDHADWDFGSGDFTVECWVYLNNVSTYQGIYGRTVDTDNKVFMRVMNDGTINWYNNDGGSENGRVTSSPVNDTTWYHVAVVRSGTVLSLYLNGVLEDSDTITGSIPDISEELSIGRYDSNGGPSWYYLNGYLSELNILKGVAKYISNFTVPQGPPGSSWDNRKKIAITDSSDNQLYTEIERWDYANEEANLWVKVPTIASGTDTDLYLYYDASATTNSGYVGDTGDSPAQQVWNSDFEGVWHLSQDPSGGSGAIKDSTSETRNLTSSGTMLTEDLVDGKIGKGIDFDGSDDELVGSDCDNIRATNFAASGWFKTTDPSPPGHIYILSNRDTSTADQFVIRVSVTNAYAVFQTYDGSSSSALTGNTPLNDGFWHHIVGVREGTQLTLYIDGDSVESESLTLRDINTSEGYKIGGIGIGGGINSFTGVIDECRVYNKEIASTWIKADYYSNCNDLVTFSSPVTFIFSGPIPTPYSTVYGVTNQLQLTTTVTGLYPSYIYDATFYDAYDDSQIETISGTQSGQYVSTYMPTPTATDYNWYLIATSSGQFDTSSTYTFSNRFMCSGHTQVAGTGASGIPVRLYRRSTGAYIGGVVSSGVSGTFDIITDYNEDHYAVALYTTSGTNALILDWLNPSN